MGAWSFEDLWSFEPELQRYPALIREITKAHTNPGSFSKDKMQ